MEVLIGIPISRQDSVKKIHFALMKGRHSCIFSKTKINLLVFAQVHWILPYTVKPSCGWNHHHYSSSFSSLWIIWFMECEKLEGMSLPKKAWVDMIDKKRVMARLARFCPMQNWHFLAEHNLPISHDTFWEGRREVKESEGMSLSPSASLSPNGERWDEGNVGRVENETRFYTSVSDRRAKCLVARKLSKI